MGQRGHAHNAGDEQPAPPDPRAEVATATTPPRAAPASCDKGAQRSTGDDEDRRRRARPTPQGSSGSRHTCLPTKGGCDLPPHDPGGSKNREDRCPISGRGGGGAQRRPPRYPTWCALCDQEFTPTKSDARFCSAACKAEAHRIVGILRVGGARPYRSLAYRPNAPDTPTCRGGCAAGRSRRWSSAFTGGGRRLMPWRPCLRCSELTRTGSYCPACAPTRSSATRQTPGRGGGAEASAFRAAVVRQAGGRCEAVSDGARCEVTEPRLLEAHHLRGLRDGGTDDAAENGVCLCRRHRRALEATKS